MPFLEFSRPGPLLQTWPHNQLGTYIFMENVDNSTCVDLKHEQQGMGVIHVTCNTLFLSCVYFTCCCCSLFTLSVCTLHSQDVDIY